MSTRWPAPDFLAAHEPRRPAIAWLWAAAGAGTLAMTLGDWRTASLELDARHQQLARFSQRVATPRPRAQAAMQASDAEAARAARSIADRIAHPWYQVMGDIEVETPAGLQWLALEHEADDSGVRLEGAAPDVATVLHFVDSLADHGGWSDVMLGRLRAANGQDATAASGWRFELQATVDARHLALAHPQRDR